MSTIVNPAMQARKIRGAIWFGLTGNPPRSAKVHYASTTR